MPRDERIFVRAIRDYCARHDIDIEVRADGWLIALSRGKQRHFAFGYDIGLNSSIAHRLADDKSATAEVLALSGVPCIPHHIFLNPDPARGVATFGWWEAMLRLLAANPQGVVVKPNEGTAGRSVLKATNRRELESAVEQLFAANMALTIAPYVEIEDEVRVVLLEEAPMIVYSKVRASVVGDGTHTVRDLARATVPDTKFGDIATCELDAIVPAGERRVLNWRHNLDAGARPALLEKGGEVWAACVQLAIDAARAIGITFASIDVVRTDGVWKVLEINSGVMMEALGKPYPEIVQAIYDAALDRVFGESAKP